ncbi:MAG: peptide chain release factor N(5)-glutamine methyltransferase [bacterium]
MAVQITTVLNRARGKISQEDAEFLLMGMLGLKRHQLYSDSRRMNRTELQKFWQIVKAAQNGVPAQYLLGKAPFLELEIFVDRRVFIPRPETEELILRASARVKNPGLILDYGTGSGCVAIALARRFPEAEVWAVDISPEALAVAEINVRRYGLTSRVRLVQVATLSEQPLDFIRGRVGLLVSNPPYIPQERLSSLPASVRDYEPMVSLDGGVQGVEVIKMLLTEGPAIISTKGVLALEIDHTQGDFVRGLVPGAEIEHDLSGQVRYVFYRKGGISC